ncbi:MAG: sigma-70 family RNA polymerase sigma factor [Planctomycetes bacterium]|nr:sigma-70 family RNA polymerase sigma factor [Planctomycetota bacterium]
MDAPKAAEERRLVQRCIAGEREAWRALMERFGALVAHAVRTTLQRVVKFADPNRVDDAVQSVWTALCEDGCRRLRGFEAKCSLSTWLTVLSTRRALDFVRTEIRKGSLRTVRIDGEDHDLLGEIAAPAADDPPSADEVERLYAALERLPDDDRIILKLYYLDGCSYRTIARALGVAPNTVSSYLLRAREKLKGTMHG